ncbi:MAG TPA: gluconate 2-dehydrogenase subunit 3 family protein [Acidimicrobiales bacterium]|nr:gluconate 2-dehydrogenase subunit 3 family protein [Acidimicrobiales bacterium]
MLSRRDFLKGVSLLPLARLVPLPAWERAAQAATETFAFFTAHQAAVVREATARIIPGPLDDPLEMGHPGAREANVTRFIDVLLSALDHHPEHIYAGGPYGTGAGQFVALSTQQRRAWETRIAALKKAYRDGVVVLDSIAGGDFSTASALDKDQFLLDDRAAGFLEILYTHAIEGTYSDPVYGGNTNRSGWTEIKFPGPSMPRGYTRAEVSASDGPDVIDPTGVVAQVLQVLGDQ